MTAPLEDDECDRSRPAASGPVLVRVPAEINLRPGVGPLRRGGDHGLNTAYRAAAGCAFLAQDATHGLQSPQVGAVERRQLGHPGDRAQLAAGDGVAQRRQPGLDPGQGVDQLGGDAIAPGGEAAGSC